LPVNAAGGLFAPDTRSLPGDPGYLLHSAELSFRHPGIGRELVLLSEPPLSLRLSK
jgi:hypothetical protein